jgi:GWxTD domain-containing protein
MKGYWMGILLAGMAALAACGGSARKIALDKDSEAFYRTARLIMTKQESAIFDHLPDAESRRDFIADFWEKRDPNPDTPENEFKTTFESRVAYANKHFHEGGPGFNTDRGRILIYMGPPDRVEDHVIHYDPNVQGSITIWTYYEYELGIEFIDENGTNQYKIRNFEGFFFDALDNLKLGQDTANGEVFKKKAVDFKLRYDSTARAFVIDLPADSVTLTDDEGRLRADLEFIIYIYPKTGGPKGKIEAARTFLVTDNEFIGMKEISFTIPHELPAGSHYVDVIIKGKEGIRGKIRKIFEVKTT